MLSKRSEVVKAAMQGMISNAFLAENWTLQKLTDAEVAQRIAHSSMEIADAVLDQLHDRTMRDARDNEK